MGDSATYPSYATVTPASNNAYVWAASTSDTRALLKAASSSDRVAGCWYSSAGFTIALNFTDGQTHQVGLYALDFDNAARSEKVEVLDSSGTVLDTRTLSNFTGGQYLVWTLGGRVTLRVTNVSGANAVIGGIFFGSPSAGGGSGGSGSSGSAAFLKNDTNTAGNWKSVYGGEGAVIVGDSAKYPTYATVTPASNNAYVWAASTSDTRALLKAASSSDRVAGCWYSSAGFTIALNFTDGQKTHQVGLYALDFDNAARSEKVEVLDSGGTVLDTRTLSNFTGGQYLVWTLGGRVTLRVTNVSGANAVIGGIFFGPGA